MNPHDEHTPDELDPDIARAIDAEPSIQARPEFAAELRRRFADGTIESALPPQAPRETRTSSRRALWGWLAVAAAIALVVWLRLRPTNAIEVLADARVHARVDGRDALLGRGGSSELAQGSTVETAAERLIVRLGSALVVEIAAHSKVTLAHVAATSGGDYELALDSGALRVVTGAAFAPSRLLVRAPDAEIKVVGTEFAVDVVPDEGTCVCCTRGELAVRATQRANEVYRVAANGRAFCFRDPSKQPAIGQPMDAHIAQIADLRPLL